MSSGGCSDWLAGTCAAVAVRLSGIKISFPPNLSDETLKRDKSPKSNLGSRRQLGTAVAPPDWPRAGGEVTTPGTNWSLVSGLIPGAPRRLGCSVV